MNIIFFGSPSYSCNVLKTLSTSQHNIAAVVTQNTKNKRDKRTPVSIYSEANNLDTLYPEDLKSKDFLKKISDYKPDLFIVYAYGKILPQILLDIPEFGAINIHCSLLPTLRGAAPIQRALLNKDKRTGITFFRIDAKLDQGRIISSHAYEINDKDDSISLQDCLTNLANKNILNAINLNKSHQSLIPQDESLATYASKINKFESVIDWNTSSIDIVHKIRAFVDWPVAETQLFGVTIKILQARYQLSEDENQPGTIIMFNRNELVFAAKDGYVYVERLQIPGKKVVHINDFFNSNSPIVSKIKEFLDK